MQKKKIKIDASQLSLNEGQVSWLPRNPREWSKDDLERTVRSIEEDEDFLEDRPVLVVKGDIGGGYVVFAGNLRSAAARERGMKAVPCILYTPEDEGDQKIIRRRAMKDNGSFGAWDYDTLANEWGDLPLVEWGVPAWNFVDKKENKSAPTGEVGLGDFNPKYDVQVTCTSLEEQLALIKELDERGIKCKAV